MDEAGIDIAILSISTPGIQLPDKLAASELARRCNELAATLISKHPKRFGAFASVPMSDINEAMNEITYALDVLKLEAAAQEACPCSAGQGIGGASATAVAAVARPGRPRSIPPSIR